MHRNEKKDDIKRTTKRKQKKIAIVQVSYSAEPSQTMYHQVFTPGIDEQWVQFRGGVVISTKRETAKSERNGGEATSKPKRKER